MTNKKKVKMFFKSLLMQLAEIETDKAKLIYDAPELAVGVEVYVESDNENEEFIPAVDGDYITNDERTIRVEGGVVVEIIEKKEEETPVEEAPTEEIQEELAEEEVVEEVVEETPAPETNEVEALREEVTALQERIEKLENLFNDLAKVEVAQPAEEQFKEIEKKASKMTKAEQMLSYLKK